MTEMLAQITTLYNCDKQQRAAQTAQHIKLCDPDGLQQQYFHVLLFVSQKQKADVEVGRGSPKLDS